MNYKQPRNLTVGSQKLVFYYVALKSDTMKKHTVNLKINKEFCSGNRS